MVGDRRHADARSAWLHRPHDKGLHRDERRPQHARDRVLAWSPRQAETHQQHGAANAQPLQRVSTARHRHAATAFEADAGRVAEQQVPAVRASKTLGPIWSIETKKQNKIKEKKKSRRCTIPCSSTACGRQQLGLLSHQKIYLSRFIILK